MKYYRVTVHCADVVAIVLADDKEGAIDAYQDGNVEDFEEPVSQPEVTAELVK